LTEKPVEKPVLAWVGTTCPWCNWTGRVEVREKDPKGRLVVRCPNCKERINIG
jgi:hypothetical protein